MDFAHEYRTLARRGRHTDLGPGRGRQGELFRGRQGGVDILILRPLLGVAKEG